MLNELVPERVYVYQAPTNTGLIINKNEQTGIMVDSGLDDSQARKVYRQASKELNVEVKGVLTTHAHADHCGGHHWLQKQGVQVLAPPFEKAWVRHPVLMPYGLFGGVHPPEYLRNKFVWAQSAQVDHVLEVTAEWQWEEYYGIDFQVISLPGHTEGQIGISHGGVAFIGDALFTPQVLEKHKHLPFNVNLEQVFNSLESVENIHDKHIVPGHGPVLATGEELSQAISQYRKVLSQNLEQVMDLIKKHGESMTGEEILAKILVERGCQQLDKSLYLLFRTAVTAMLAYLEDKEKIESYVCEGNLVYDSL
ncbi:MBL fold metallo-hydrolase [Natranaerobius thermophilus]|uniref:Beta-lactamase domain protein n=1 Tax=Natranaerobius thermophilus (strain ATCC BAA-1301 / DSM 18059 / JW/NM-WN-LF) TaxID=457570 RepID=B2A7Y5_NATTJ|nr:MBL fold metallo-hydrolase [Natranaerobius thermophilus]ACB85757.1 beta-lactamase domain protein [Natranaerobius thermophilus JW/NM-WN-LF]